MAELEKEKRIKEELKRMSSFFQEIDEDKKAVAGPLLQNAAFMKVTLDDLQTIINNEGVTDEYQNGANQYGIKQSATLQSYNSLIKNYTTVIRSLSQILPSGKTSKPLSEVYSQKSRVKSEEEKEAEAREREEDARYFAEAAGQLLRTGTYEDKETWRTRTGQKES